MQHEHPLKTVVPDFRIDPKTREVIQTGKEPITVMQFDHNSENLLFECPREVDGHDMSLCDKVEVHFVNSVADGSGTAVGKYRVKDIAASPSDPNLVHFTWVVDRNATNYVGTLVFAVQFTCLDGTKIDYAWHTLPFSYISVDQGLVNELDESYQEIYLDNLETEAEGRIDQITTATLDRAIKALENSIINDVQSLSARMDTFTKLAEGSTTGDAELIDARVGADGVNYTTAGTAVREQFKSIHEDINQIALFSKNLFNKDAEGILNGYYLNVSGEENKSVDMFTSDFIPVHYNKTYSVLVARSFYGANSNKVIGYNANKEKVGVLSGSVENDILTLTVDDQRVKYVRFSQYTNQLETLMFVEGESLPEQYIPYVHKLTSDFALNEKQLAEVDLVIATRLKENNLLFRKSIALNGDSICRGSEEASNYGEIIAERNGMVLTNIAVAGGTITAGTYIASTGDARHWICRTIKDMPADVDFAIVEGGVNDASLRVPLGKLSSGFKATLDETTFYGAFESMLRQLVTRFAGKKYGYIAVHKMSDRYRSEDPVETSYYHAARLCCQKWGVPFCDLNVSVPPFVDFTPGSGEDLYALREAYTLNADGWHPNKQGYEKYYCDKIEAWLKTL